MIGAPDCHIGSRGSDNFSFKLTFEKIDTCSLGKGARIGGRSTRFNLLRSKNLCTVSRDRTLETVHYKRNFKENMQGYRHKDTSPSKLDVWKQK